jgi:predicted amidohydrolase YtcJ
MSQITIYQANKILTMDPNRPHATHVAVKDGRILAVGDNTCGDAWGNVQHDTRFKDNVLMPGFVEGHAHMMAGAIWKYAYAGFHNRVDPDGKIWKGMKNLDEVIAGLSDYAEGLPKSQPIIAWGFDPIFLTDERLSRIHLDKISQDRPVAILFSNFHLMCVNSATLNLVGYDQSTNVEGVIKGADGFPNGELQEMAAMFPIMRRLGIDFRSLTQREDAIHDYAKVAMRAGVTTVTDLFAEMTDNDVDMLLSITAGSDYPIRLVPVLAAMGGVPEEIAIRALALRDRSTEKLRLGAVKLMTDGSIQGWTARVKWPGYVNGHTNGIWNTPPETIQSLCTAMQAAGVQMHIHVNGDEASEVVINAISEAIRKHPWPNHRHVLQHGQMMARDQFERCAELGLTVNLFANHIWYFGDQHAALTIGEDRAERMDACRSALDAGVTLAIHSDAPVTPMGPLFTAWCAVNRQTMSGRTLGVAQKLSVQEALEAITLGAARTLKMDQEIGSIEIGKRADFAVLATDPSSCDPMELKEIKVLGTVLDGQAFLA